MSLEAAGRAKHMGATKLFVKKAILAYGAKEVLSGWTGTDAEALAELDKDPRDIFCSCACLKDEHGACTGEVPR